MKPLDGLTIMGVIPLPKRIAQREGWDGGEAKHAVALLFSDGSLVYASRDDEGNGPGVLFGVEAGGDGFRVDAVERQR